MHTFWKLVTSASQQASMKILDCAVSFAFIDFSVLNILIIGHLSIQYPGEVSPVAVFSVNHT